MNAARGPIDCVKLKLAIDSWRSHQQEFFQDVF